MSTNGLSSGSKRGSRPAEVDEVDWGVVRRSVFVPDKVPETERAQFSVLTFLVLLHASFLMLLLTEILQRLKTG